MQSETHLEWSNKELKASSHLGTLMKSVMLLHHLWCLFYWDVEFQSFTGYYRRTVTTQAGEEAKKYFKAFCADKMEQNYIFVYLNDLIFGGLLCKLPDPINKLFVSCVVGFSSINHPDTQFHQLERKEADVSVRGGNGEMKKCINNRNTSVNIN